MFNFLKSKPEQPKTLGQLGEEFAQEEYKNRGYKVIAANFFNKKGKRLGEIDFVAINKTTIVFVEVKTRRTGSEKFGTGAEAVNTFKQIKLLKAIKVFFQLEPKYLELKPQIDVCLVHFDELDKNPFSVTILSNAVEDWN